MSTYLNEETGKYENFEKAVVDELERIRQILADAAAGGDEGSDET